MQALGTTIAVALEQDADPPDVTKPPEVRFFEFGDTFEAIAINRLVLDGSRGEPAQGPNSGAKAGSVAFTRLRDGHYLLFVHDNGQGWFYRSNTVGIDPDTQWRFVQHWTPGCTGDVVGCWSGANNMTFLTDGEGQIFLVAMDGSDSGAETVNLHRVVQDEGGAIDLPSIALHQPEYDSIGVDLFHPSVPWGGTSS